MRTENQNLLSFVSWRQLQCDQLPQTPPAMPSRSLSTVLFNSGPKQPFLPCIIVWLAGKLGSFIFVLFCCQVSWLIKNLVTNIPSEASNTLCSVINKGPKSLFEVEHGGAFGIQRCRCLGSKLVWSTKGVSGHPGQHRETLSCGVGGLYSKKPSLLLPLQSLTDSSEQVESDPLVFITSKMS